MASNDRARASDLECAAAKIRARGAHIWVAALALGIAVAPLPANAGDLPNLPGVGSPSPLIPAPTGNWVLDWLNMVSASQAAQPKWMTPLVTVTPRLEQEFRWDVYDQKNGTGTQGNGQRLVSYGGPGGARIELILAYNWEVILAPPPYVTASGPRGTGQGTGDWPMFLVKYRLISANKDNSDYIVTAFFQMSDPSGTCCAISNNVLVAQPTLAFGKGWGDFDIQSTISVQVPVDSFHCLPAGPTLCTAVPKTGTFVGNFGDPILWNTTFQYHLWQYFWPAVEVNYEFWPNGTACRFEPGFDNAGAYFGSLR